ncbi:hypothetical protein [uncultured Sulfitobacter sp.]|jgi:hypothetical protein
MTDLNFDEVNKKSVNSVGPLNRVLSGVSNLIKGKRPMTTLKEKDQ